MSSQRIKEHFEEKMNDNPQSLVFARLADLYLQEDRIDEAIQLCQEGLKGNPLYVTGYYILAKAFIQNNDLERAESALKKVLSYDRNFISAHKHLGDIMIKLGWENTAATHYKDILQIDPLEKTALNALENLSEDASDSIELPSTQLIDEPASPEEFQTEKTSSKDEEWINQIREVFPDELSDYSEVSEQEAPSEKDAESTVDFNEFEMTMDNPEAVAKEESETETTTSEISSPADSEPENEFNLENIETDWDAVDFTQAADKPKFDEQETPPTDSKEKVEPEIDGFNFTDEDFEKMEFSKDSTEQPDTTEEPEEIIVPQDIEFESINLEEMDFEVVQKPIADQSETDFESETSPKMEPADEIGNAEEIQTQDISDIPMELDEDTIQEVTETDTKTETTTEELETAEEFEFENIELIDIQETSSSEESANEPAESMPVESVEPDSTAETINTEQMAAAMKADMVSETEHEEIIELPEVEAPEPEELKIDIIEEDSEKDHEANVPDRAGTITSDFEPIETTESIPEKIVKPAKSSKRPESSTEEPDQAPDEKQKQPEAVNAPKILTPTLGEIYIAQEQFDKALDIYKQLAELYPNEQKYKDKIHFIKEKIKDSSL